MFLVDSKESKKSTGSVEEGINALIEKCKGQVIRFEMWDERKIAYEINGTSNGTYYLYYFSGDPETISQLNRECKLSPLVLRALFLRVKKIPDPETTKPREREDAFGDRGYSYGRRDRDRDRASKPDVVDAPKEEVAESPEEVSGSEDVPEEPAGIETVEAAPTAGDEEEKNIE
jgi:small subunit ribosomal protein S6